MAQLNWKRNASRFEAAPAHRIKRERTHLFPITCAQCGHEGERMLTTEQAIRATFRCYLCGHRQPFKLAP